MYLPKRFTYLKEDEIAGAETINPIIDFLRGIRSASDFIEINPNGNNSMSIDLDLKTLRRALDIKDTDTILEHNFHATGVSDTSYTISAGKVFVGCDNSISISSHTVSGTGSVYLQLTQNSNPSWQTGIPSKLFNPTNQSINLPLLNAYRDDGEWHFHYYHIGDFIVEKPYFWVSNYDKTKQQFLSHNANTDDVYWQDVTDCEE